MSFEFAQAPLEFAYQRPGEMLCKTTGKVTGQAKVTWAGGAFARIKL